MKGWGLQGEWEPRSRGVDLRGGAHDPKVRQASFVRKQKVKRWEAGLNGQDIRGGQQEAVGYPPLDLVPEHGELPKHVGAGQKDVRTITKDGEEEGGGQPMAEEAGEANPRGGETFDSHEGPLGLGQPFDKVGSGGDRGGEPVAQPPDLTFR